MGRRRKVEIKEMQEAAQHQVSCRHHWLIETPHGPTSTGVCRRCGEVRDFQNFLEEAPGGRDEGVSGLPGERLPWQERPSGGAKDEEKLLHDWPVSLRR